MTDYPCWSSSLKTGPTYEPVSLEEAKAHLRVTDTDEDDLITSLVQAGREYVEAFTNRAVLPQTWYWKADRLPCVAIWLPKPPLVSITSVTFVDESGGTQTWAPTSGYQLSKPTGPKASYARLMPAYGNSWPVTRWQFDAVTIEYVAGYADAASVPESIKAAIKMLVGHWYENRESVVVGQAAPLEVPLAVPALLGPFVVGQF